LIGNANYSNVTWQGIKIKRGQLVRSYRVIANDIAFDKGYIHKEPSIATISNLFKELVREERIELAPLPALRNKEENDKPRTKQRGYLITLIKYNTLQGLLSNVLNRERTESNKELLSKKKVIIYSLFEFWNSLKIIQHQKIDKFVRSLETAIKDYPGIQVRKAMVNYSTVLKQDKYFFKYRLTIKEFLVRGLERFLDINKPLENFLTDKKGEKEVYPKYEKK